MRHNPTSGAATVLTAALLLFGCGASNPPATSPGSRDRGPDGQQARLAQQLMQPVGQKLVSHMLQLDLDGETARRISAIENAARTETAPLAAQITGRAQSVRTALLEDEFDASAIRRRVSELAVLREQIALRWLDAYADARSLLNEDQIDEPRERANRPPEPEERPTPQPRGRRGGSGGKGGGRGGGMGW